MRSATLLQRNLAYYWRTNLAVIFGVATAVSVLAGALVVGDSVRASLRNLFLERLGRTDQVIVSGSFFREQLANDIQSHERFAASGFTAVCPLMVLEGTATHERSGRRGTRVQVYGVDQRFWRFHGRENLAGQLTGVNEAFLSESLASELSTAADDVVLLRVEKPSAIPIESLHGRKEEAGRTVRLTVRGALPPAQLGEFSIRPQQTAVRAVFVPLQLLQKSLEQAGQVNTLLVSTPDAGSEPPETETPSSMERLHELLKAKFTLEDLGVKLRILQEQQSLTVESVSGLINDALAETARVAADKLQMRPAPVFSYLANSIRAGEREIPYSLVTAFAPEKFEQLKNMGTKTTADMAESRLSDAQQSIDSSQPEPSGHGSASSLSPIILNEWAARDLGAKTGDTVTLEYYLWSEDGRLTTQTAPFRLTGIVPIEGPAADRELVPDYPGITGSEGLADWDPPFPIDLARIRPRDEDYWDQYRTTPKAFIPFDTGQQLWQSRFGKLTSMRLQAPAGLSLEQASEAYQAGLRASLNPAQGGLTIYPVRAEGLAASRGATDFGEYFLYFSLFLVISAMLLTALFFRLGIEQRLREIGILQSIGFPASQVRRIFLGEAVVLTLAGSCLGMLGAYVYGRVMMHGLRTWWVGAVGTTALSLHATPKSFLFGAAGGMLTALICIAWTLKGLSRHSTRSLLAGSALHDPPATGQTSAANERTFTGPVKSFFTARRAAAVLSFAGLSILLASAMNLVGPVAGFFGGGALMLMALLCLQAAWLRRHERGMIGGSGWWPVFHLGLRNATHRPGRSVMCITLIAFAAFIIIAVDAFRRDDRDITQEKKSGHGGFLLMAESLLPIVHDPNTAQGRETLNLVGAGPESDLLEASSFARFRLRPGDDASCLNLYQPRQPRILAPTDDFLRHGRFAFHSSLDATAEEKENPWLLLHRELADGAIPIITDANSMTYVLHLKLGEDFILERGGGAVPLRLRPVAALADSIFQGELLMSEKNFLRHFPEQEGYRFFLLDVPTQSRAREIAGALEERLADFGFDIVPTAEKLANFHRVENTFLSTFQMLGALGLALGTVGLAAVLLRNVLERRRELALLRAVGYNRSHFSLMVIAENALLLGCGLATGIICALLAVAPVIFSRGGRFPFVSLGGLLVAVIASGMLASLLATAAALRSPLLPALRAE